MTTLTELCHLLGRSWNGVESRGRPAFILRHLEAFSKDWPTISDKELAGKFFLDHQGKKLFNHSECAPKLPEDRDEILGLVTQAFHLLQDVQSNQDQQQLSGSQNSDSVLTTETAKGDTPLVTETSQADVGMIGEQPALKTEQQSDDPVEPMAIDASVPAPSDPIVNSSKFELVRLLQDWITSHPNVRIPELGRYDRNVLESGFAMEASLAETGERIWIIRLGVLDMYQGWVLEKADGSIILVKANYRKGGYLYYGWLGGDLGFSEEVIAHHKDVPRSVLTLRLYSRKRNLDPEDVLNEYDISKEALEFEESSQMPMTPGSATSITDGRDSDSEISSPPSDSDEPLAVHQGSRKRSIGNDKAPNAKKRAKVWSSPSPSISTSAVQDLQNIDDPKLRAKIKCLYKVFPAVSIAVCECVLLKNKGSVEDAIDDLYGLQNVPTSTDTTVVEDGPPAKSTGSRRSKAHASMPRTPSPIRTSGFSTTQQLPTPLSNAHSPLSLGYPTPRTPSILTTARNPISIFKFFLSDPTMGAVPMPFTSIQSDTSTKSKFKFFTEAVAAHFLTTSSILEQENESVVAASVVISGMSHPIV
ncbi:MAG: hypothetical protein Q9169_008470, partial [Polycauliona sp. 2 TL-2023]